MLGKLKRSLKDRCPLCGKTLQLRVREIESINRGMEALIPEEYVCCSNKNCFYEQEIEQKRVRRKGKEEDLTL